MLGVINQIALRLLPFIIISCGLFCFFYFHLDVYLSFESLKEHRQFLTEWTRAHYFLAVGIYMLSYIVSVLCLIPIALFLTLTAGFLFGIEFGFLYAACSALIGATLFFLLVGTALADWLAEKLGEKLQHFEEGFRENAFNYILTMRLIPVFPFFIVNLASALLGVRLNAFFSATAIGILPATLIYVSLGHGLGKIFDHHETPNLEVLFQPHIFIPLVLLALLAILPVIYKKLVK